MTYGHDMNTAVIPLVQTVFFPKDAVGVKQIERFSARVFPEDLIRHSDSIWLNGRYEIHLDYYGIEGKKMYKNRVDLPLKLEMPVDWQETDENNIDVSIDCRKLDVLAPYVLEFSGRIAVKAQPEAAAARLAMERADAEFEAGRAELANGEVKPEEAKADNMSEDKAGSENRQENKKPKNKEKYIPDPLVREVMAEYEEQTAAKSFGGNKQKSAKIAELPNIETKADKAEKSPINTVADLAAAKEQKADEKKSEAAQDNEVGTAKFGKGFTLSDRAFRKNKQKREEASSQAAEVTAEMDDVDLKSLKSRTILKLKKRDGAADDSNKSQENIAVKSTKTFAPTLAVSDMPNAVKAPKAQAAQESAKAEKAEKAEAAETLDVSANDNTEVNKVNEVSIKTAKSQPDSDSAQETKPVEIAAAPSQVSDSEEAASAVDLAEVAQGAEGVKDEEAAGGSSEVSSVEVSAPDLAVPAQGMDFGDLMLGEGNAAPIVFTAEQEDGAAVEADSPVDGASAKADNSESAAPDGRIVAASGLAANLKMVNNQSAHFIESLAKISNEPYYLKYGKVQAGDGETWQRTE